MKAARLFKKSVVTLVGFALVILGIILMLLPGPGLLVTVAGFAILATEYTWARRALDTSRRKAIEGQKQVARNPLTYLGQHVAGIGLIAVAVLFLFRPTLPLASGASATMLIVGGTVLITSAVLARRKYS